jgi:hypothetical protein
MRAPGLGFGNPDRISLTPQTGLVNHTHTGNIVQTTVYTVLLTLLDQDYIVFQLGLIISGLNQEAGLSGKMGLG